MALIDKLKALGDAIREKTGKTQSLTLTEMETEVKNIAGIYLPKVITPGDTPMLISELSCYGTMYGNGPKPTGIYIDIPRDGTYRFKYEADVPAYDQYPGQTLLYKNGVQMQSFNSGASASSYNFAGGKRSKQSNSADIECKKGDRIEVYVYTNQNYDVTFRMVYAYSLIACINMDQ